MYLNHVQEEEEKFEERKEFRFLRNPSQSEYFKNKNCSWINSSINSNKSCTSEERFMKREAWFSSMPPVLPMERGLQMIGSSLNTAFKRNIPSQINQPQFHNIATKIIDNKKFFAPTAIKPYGNSILLTENFNSFSIPDIKFSNEMNMDFSKNENSEFSDLNRVNVFTERSLEVITKQKFASLGLKSLSQFSSMDEDRDSQVPNTMMINYKKNSKKQIKIGYEEEDHSLKFMPAPIM